MLRYVFVHGLAGWAAMMRSIRKSLIGGCETAI